MNLAGKKIILGITGSIAAYKSVYLLRYLVKEGADVQVIMTPSAKEFVGPVTFSALSGKPVLSDFFDEKSGDWSSHVNLGTTADLMVIAPVTATTLGKCASGIADNLLITTYLSARCPVIFAPAMDTDMYMHPSTGENRKKLEGYGNFFIEPDTGELASGLEGKGRLAEPEKIMEFLKAFKPESSKKKMNKSVLITAGPTHETIDPVRFIGNHSTGKMGYAIAGAFAKAGASVTLISGPVNIRVEDPFIRTIRVTTALEMFKVCREHIEQADIAVFSAAVADFMPVKQETEKIRSGKNELKIILKPTPDIAGEMGKIKRPDQIFVGFALETSDELEHARRKLVSKNLDLIVLNSLKDEGAGFGVDTNKVTFIDREGKIEKSGLKSKTEVAKDIYSRIEKMLKDA